LTLRGSPDCHVFVLAMPFYLLGGRFIIRIETNLLFEFRRFWPSRETMRISPLKPIKAVVQAAGRWYIRRLCRAESNNQVFRCHNERPIEYRFALECLAEARAKSVLDVGTGTTAWPHILRNCGFVVTAIDNIHDYWGSDVLNRHWTVLDVDITHPDGFSGHFDAITCISVIEHIVEHERAFENMLRLLAPGGILILTTPYSHHEYCANVYERSDASYGSDALYICRSHSATEIQAWQNLGARLRRRELWRLFSGPVWATGERIEWQRAETEDCPHHLGCFAFEKATALLS
jgi:2-polyprenyl-3-methyl-5-hydroxy-6-metoxy-1,4-benzoquinol methylase